jgi:hypothetical protein
MKYKVIKTDLLFKGKIIPENTELDLSESDTKGIEDYLEKLQDDSQKEKENKTKRGNK